jgi:hypothetical protein
MPTISTLSCRLAAPLFCLALIGCVDPNQVGDNLPRKAVTGTVTLDGQPLSEGMIQFEPAERKPGTTLAVGEIKDGKFAIDRTLGPVPGNYKILISSRPPIKHDPTQSPGPLPKAAPEKVPAQFNSKSTLTKEITDASVNTVELDLKSN